MAFAVRAPAAAAFISSKVAGVAPRAPRTRLVVRADKPEYDRATGFVAEDNSGRANIFPTKAQAYIASSKSDAAARQGLGGAQGGILVGFVIGAVALVTVLGLKSPGPETLQSVGSTYEGEPLTAIAARIQKSL
ncbi:hypothetical protein COO60DRAFT_1519238 [Scenedesmus sp. NREL 46B-D3]|nr:hypothetical protein COO60DRAFT_1566877 [Scenedesmus sp. NREL 46B-D3]KAF6258419.1 hypothetical protein COO60DRAFT_1519238 [Scenedesmus sp. NREL 46B-D3]